MPLQNCGWPTSFIFWAKLALKLDYASCSNNTVTQKIRCCIQKRMANETALHLLRNIFFHNFISVLPQQRLQLRQYLLLMGLDN